MFCGWGSGHRSVASTSESYFPVQDGWGFFWERNWDVICLSWEPFLTVPRQLFDFGELKDDEAGVERQHSTDTSQNWVQALPSLVLGQAGAVCSPAPCPETDQNCWKINCVNLLLSKISPQLSLSPPKSCVRFTLITFRAFPSTTSRSKQSSRKFVQSTGEPCCGLTLVPRAPRLALAPGSRGCCGCWPPAAALPCSPRSHQRGGAGCRRSPPAPAKCDLDAVIKGLLFLPRRACPARKRDFVWWGAGELWDSVRAEGSGGSSKHPLSSAFHSAAAGTDLCRGRRARQLW